MACEHSTHTQNKFFKLIILKKSAEGYRIQAQDSAKPEQTAPSKQGEEGQVSDSGLPV